MRKHAAERIEQSGMGLEPSTRSGVLSRAGLGISMKFAAGVEIYGEGEPVEYVHEILHGAVRTVKMLSDGRRTIGGFYFAGDVLSIEHGRNHSLSAEAIVDTGLRVAKCRTLIRTVGSDRELARELFGLTSQEIVRVHDHALMLIKTAQERVASFLLEMWERISVHNLVLLPMPRQDIADYLGVTIETVSRTFTLLENSRVIALPNARTVVVRDPSALADGYAPAVPSLRTSVQVRDVSATGRFTGNRAIA
jgi:CRP/FNR family nitrogen fixation transcriptional regulator